MRGRWAMVVALVGLAGCVPVTLVRVQPVPLLRALAAPQPSVAEGKGLSRYTNQLLSRASTVDGGATIEARFAAASAASDAPTADRELALAELALQSALKLEKAQPDIARARYLLAAAYAQDALVELTAGPASVAFDGRLPLARDLYNTATGKVLAALLARRSTVAAFDAVAASRHYHVVVDDAETARLLAYFDEMPLAWTLDIDGLRTRYERDGLGVPLVGWRRARGDEPGWRYGPDGLAAPLTGCLQFDGLPGESRTVHVLLRDSRGRTPTCLAGEPAPMAADFSAPLALSWSRSRAAQLGREGLRGLPEAERNRGFQLLEPYDPKRIPLVLVHGLASSPQTWRNLTNDVLGSAELRERYQVWHYAYPTAEPFLMAAQRFRADLRELLDDLDVPADAGIVVVGHSMGGLLAKSLVVDSGSVLWNAAFTVPPAELQVSPDTLHELQDALVLKPFPEIGRVVFVGTPHGGSELANTWWARVIDGMIELPAHLHGHLDEVVRSNPEQVQPSLRRALAAGRITSIDAMSPDQPLLQAFRGLPVDPRVPFDSFYGVADTDALGHATDGAVRADDARVAGAASEHAVAVRHGDFDKPEVLVALRRILELHAGSARASAVRIVAAR